MASGDRLHLCIVPRDIPIVDIPRASRIPIGRAIRPLLGRQNIVQDDVQRDGAEAEGFQIVPIGGEGKSAQSFAGAQSGRRQIRPCFDRIHIVQRGERRVPIALPLYNRPSGEQAVALTLAASLDRHPEATFRIRVDRNQLLWRGKIGNILPHRYLCKRQLARILAQPSLNSNPPLIGRDRCDAIGEILLEIGGQTNGMLTVALHRLCAPCDGRRADHQSDGSDPKPSDQDDSWQIRQHVCSDRSCRSVSAIDSLMVQGISTRSTPSR